MGLYRIILGFGLALAAGVGAQFLSNGNYTTGAIWLSGALYPAGYFLGYTFTQGRKDAEDKG